MLIIPAIDLLDAQVVRLTRGSYDLVTVYSDKPGDFAKKWQELGAKLIHVVDLDAAKEGKLKNLDSVKAILKQVQIPVEFGGGIRSMAAAKQVIDIGVSRIVTGTKAAEDVSFIAEMVKKFGDKVVVGIDSSDGFLAVRGWLARTNIKAADLAIKMRDIGVKFINYTEVSKDGTLSGPNMENIRTFLNTVKGVSVAVAGGISTLDDLKKLKAMKADNLCGVIVGKALYENRIDLKEALKI